MLHPQRNRKCAGRQDSRNIMCDLWPFKCGLSSRGRRFCRTDYCAGGRRKKNCTCIFVKPLRRTWITSYKFELISLFCY